MDQIKLNEYRVWLTEGEPVEYDLAFKVIKIEDDTCTYRYVDHVRLVAKISEILSESRQLTKLEEVLFI